MLSNGENWTISEKSLTMLGTLTASMAPELLELSAALDRYAARLKEIARDDVMPPSQIGKAEIIRPDGANMTVTISSRQSFGGIGVISLVAEWSPTDG